MDVLWMGSLVLYDNKFKKRKRQANFGLNAQNCNSRTVYIIDFCKLVN
jgi:hypothetical protein